MSTRRRRVTLWWAAPLLLALGGCKPEVTVTRLPNEPPGNRTANSFIHCVERNTASCIKPDQAAVGWNSFFLLQWLAHGSPTSFINTLPRELANRRDARLVERRMVAEVERYAIALRGAGCDAVEQEPLVNLIEVANKDARDRFAALGMWTPRMAQTVSVLAREAHQELDGGFLIRMECGFSPYQLFAATQMRNGEYTVVGLTTLMPERLMGKRLSVEQVDERLHSRSLGLDTATGTSTGDLINRWLPISVEEF